MRSEPSKPSSDAGFGPVAPAALTQATGADSSMHNGGGRVARLPQTAPFNAQQRASAFPRPLLTGRHKAPTGAPACTPVHVGGEGTTSARAVDQASGGDWIARCTLPNGTRKTFRDLPGFDAYVAVWRAAGFVLTWHNPRTVVISRRDSGPAPQPTAAQPAATSTPSPQPEGPSHGQTRFGHCQARLVRAPLLLCQHWPVFVSGGSRGHLPVRQARATCAAVALGEGMSQKPDQPSFAWWSTPTTRALHTPATQPAAGLQRRPFSRPNVATKQRVSSALPTAEIFLFTGSNTPYESHE